MNMKPTISARIPFVANDAIMQNAADFAYFQRISEVISSNRALFAVEGGFPELNADISDKFLIMWGWRASQAEVDFLKRFRKAAPNAPALIIAANNDVAARDKAFELSIDNYCGPDASLLEMAAKVDRLVTLSERTGIREAPLVFGNIKIWRNAKIVLCGGEKVSLGGREFALLISLAANSPFAVSRETLERDAFNFNHNPGTNVVAVHIHRIREKIKDNGAIIETVSGIGYRLKSAEA